VTPLVPALLLALSVTVLGLRASPRRLGRALPGRPAGPSVGPSAGPWAGPSAGPSAAPGPPEGGSLPPRAACLVAAVAVVLLLPPVLGVPSGAAVAALGPRALGRLEPASVRRRRERLRADAPLLLDLLAACLAGGASLAASARAVAHGVPGPAGERLADVAAALEVGTPPAVAWAALSPDDDDPLAPAARALRRAAEGGAPVAAAVARLAADARADARSAGEEAARRAGVTAVAPLGLCFLPAFVLLGVVPVVVGLAAPLLAGL
jgi:pilus assembly protein TadC